MHDGLLYRFHDDMLSVVNGDGLPYQILSYVVVLHERGASDKVVEKVLRHQCSESNLPLVSVKGDIDLSECWHLCNTVTKGGQLAIHCDGEAKLSG